VAKAPKVVLSDAAKSILRQLGIDPDWVELNYHKRTRGSKGGWCVHFGDVHLPFYVNRKMAAAWVGRDIADLVQSKIDAHERTAKEHREKARSLRLQADEEERLARAAGDRAMVLDARLCGYKNIVYGEDWAASIQVGDVVSAKMVPGSRFTVDELRPAAVGLLWGDGARLLITFDDLRSRYELLIHYVPNEVKQP